MHSHGSSHVLMHARQAEAAEKPPSKEKFAMTLRPKEARKSPSQIRGAVDRPQPHRTEFSLATVTPPIEPEDYSYSQPDFFMHAYAGGKRAYKAFNCQRYTKVVIFHQRPAKGVWKCAGCIKRLVAGAMDED